MTATTTATTVFLGQECRTAADYDALPPGTLVGSANADYSYRKGPRGGWTRIYTYNGQEDRAEHPRDRYSMTQVIASPMETTPILLYRNQFRDYAWRHTESRGTDESVTRRSLDTLGCGDGLQIVTGAPVTSTYVLRRLPNGTLVQRGNPNQWSSYGVFRIDSGQPHPILGQSQWSPSVSTVLTVNDEQVIPEVTADNQDQIIRFRSQAWAVVKRVKSQTGWCPTFDGIMAGFGITAACAVKRKSLNGLGVGDFVGPLDAATLPVGSVLYWEADVRPAQNFQYFLRVENARNQAGTVRWLGLRDDGVEMRHFMDRMRVASIPDEEGIHVLAHPHQWTQEFWDLIPPGTEFSNQASQVGNFVMHYDHRGRELDAGDPRTTVGRHRFVDYGNGPFAITRIGASA